MARYNFYGYLALTLDTTHRGYRRYFENEYARITSGELGEPGEPPVSIDVQIVKELPAVQPGDVARTERYKKLFTYHYLVRGIDTPHVTIYFQRHWVDRVYMNAIGVFVQAQVLEPIMYQKLLETGILFMHAGGVTEDGKGILLPAYGGTGKTTLSMALLNKGDKLLGDDLLIVDIEKQLVYPYPRPLHIFTYNVQNLRGAKIPFKYKFAVYFKNVIRWFLERILRTEFLISTRIHADEIFPGDIFGTVAPVAAIAFLRKEGPGVEVVEVTDANVDAIADGIAESADLNDSLDVLLEGHDEIVAANKKLEHDVISRLLRARGLIAYVNTRALDLDHLEDFVPRVLGTVTK